VTVGLLVATFLYAIGSALVPVLNLEVYLGAVAAKAPDAPFWELALLAGGGQMVGKVLWYHAGRHSLRLPWMRRKMDSERWQASYRRWSGWIAARHGHTGAVCLLAAFTGIPPFAVVSVLAGSLRMNFWLFLGTGLVGRTLRFAAVLAGVGLLFGHH
jgi:membrane protein YqaA with SNARE-associated domain